MKKGIEIDKLIKINLTGNTNLNQNDNLEYQVGYVNDGQIEFYDNKFIRKGMFVGNKMEGWGVEIDLKNMVVQEGSFNADRRSGYGQMIKGGDVYLGIFEGDTFNEVT